MLSHFLKTTAEDTPHPTDEGRSIWDARQDSGSLFGNRTDGVIIFDDEAATIRALEVTAADSVGVNPLGSGSDYTVFLQRLGVCLPFIKPPLETDACHRSRAPTKVSVRLLMTPCTTTTPSTTLSDGKNSMLTLASTDTYAIPAYPRIDAHPRLGGSCKASRSIDFAVVQRSRPPLQHDALRL